MLLYLYRYILSIKIVFLIIGGVLLWGYTTKQNYTETAPVVFLLQLTPSMDIADIVKEQETISRWTAAQELILTYLQTLHKQQPIGLIGFNDTTRSYLIPPTTDHLFFTQRLPLYHSNTYLGEEKPFVREKETTNYILLGDGWKEENFFYRSMLPSPPSLLTLITLGKTTSNTANTTSLPFIPRNDTPYTKLSPICCTPTAHFDDIIFTKGSLVSWTSRFSDTNLPIRASVFIALGL